MGKQQNLDVKNNYAFYVWLLEHLKVVISSPIYLSQKPDNVKYLLGDVGLTCDKENLQLLAERNKATVTHYGIKIRALCLCPHPIMRFDSDGPTHSNNFESIPLSERQVTTPHFHRFNEDGFEIAYKTAFLTAENEPNIQNDMNLGLRHFSEIGNVRCADNAFPTVEDAVPTLFDTLESDPLNGVSFGT